MPPRRASQASESDDANAKRARVGTVAGAGAGASGDGAGLARKSTSGAHVGAKPRTAPRFTTAQLNALRQLAVKTDGTPSQVELHCACVKAKIAVASALRWNGWDARARDAAAARSAKSSTSRGATPKEDAVDSSKKRKALPKGGPRASATKAVAVGHAGERIVRQGSESMLPSKDMRHAVPARAGSPSRRLWGGATALSSSVSLGRRSGDDAGVFCDGDSVMQDPKHCQDDESKSGEESLGERDTDGVGQPRVRKGRSPGAVGKVPAGGDTPASPAPVNRKGQRPSAKGALCTLLDDALRLDERCFLVAHESITDDFAREVALHARQHAMQQSQEGGAPVAADVRLQCQGRTIKPILSAHRDLQAQALCLNFGAMFEQWGLPADVSAEDNARIQGLVQAELLRASECDIDEH